MFKKKRMNYIPFQCMNYLVNSTKLTKFIKIRTFSKIVTPI